MTSTGGVKWKRLDDKMEVKNRPFALIIGIIAWWSNDQERKCHKSE